MTIVANRWAWALLALARLQPDGCGGGDLSFDSPTPSVPDAEGDAGADAVSDGSVADAGKHPRPGDPCSTRADCDDGVFCTGIEECIAGACTSTRNAACRDPGGCALALCDEGAGGCGFDAIAATCTVGVCTLERGCQPLDGCTGDADPKCDDGRSCTDDRCLAGQCVHVPVDARCDAVSTCGVGVCLGDAVADPRGCGARPDASRCKVTEGCGVDFACHPLAATCTSDRDCTDGNLCDGVERCVGGRCVHGERTTCVARNACEHASCSQSGVGDPWCRLEKLAGCP